jgi:hypothetical protein
VSDTIALPRIGDTVHAPDGVLHRVLGVDRKGTSEYAANGEITWHAVLEIAPAADVDQRIRDGLGLGRRWTVPASWVTVPLGATDRRTCWHSEDGGPSELLTAGGVPLARVGRFANAWAGFDHRDDMLTDGHRTAADARKATEQHAAVASFPYWGHGR